MTFRFSSISDMRSWMPDVSHTIRYSEILLIIFSFFIGRSEKNPDNYWRMALRWSVKLFYKTEIISYYEVPLLEDV